MFDIIKDFLTYDRDSGVFVCKKSYCNKIKVGDAAGGINAKGYVELRFKGRRYYGHRLAWWWVHGEMPSEVDHRDLDRGNNRIANLRVPERGQNVANAGRRKASGFKGVYLDRRTGRWQAKIKVNYTSIHLGVFDDEENAARAYDTAAIAHFGAFARTNLAAAT